VFGVWLFVEVAFVTGAVVVEFPLACPAELEPCESGVGVEVIGIATSVEVAVVAQTPCTLLHSPFLIVTQKIWPVAWSVISKPWVTAAVSVCKRSEAIFLAVRVFTIQLPIASIAFCTACAIMPMNVGDCVRRSPVDEAIRLAVLDAILSMNIVLDARLSATAALNEAVVDEVPPPKKAKVLEATLSIFTFKTLMALARFCIERFVEVAFTPKFKIPNSKFCVVLPKVLVVLASAFKASFKEVIDLPKQVTLFEQMSPEIPRSPCSSIIMMAVPF